MNNHKNIQRSKRCSKCNQSKSLSEFYKRRDSPDGYRSECKTCTLTHMRQYYQEHKPERQRYRQENAVRIKAQKHEYNLKHADEIATYNRQYRQDHPGAVRAAVTRWRQANPDYYKTQKWRRRQRSYTQAYHQRHPGQRAVINQRHRTARAGASGTYTADDWLTLLSQYPCCPCCSKPFTDKMPPTADHIVPLSAKGSYSISNIQPLCRSCNTKKGTKIIDYRRRA